MSLGRLENLELLKTTGNGQKVLQGTGISLDQVATVERELKCDLFDDFREYLLKYGWLFIGPWKLCGVGKAGPVESDLVKQSQYYSKMTSNQAVAIVHDGGEHMYIFPVVNGKTIDRIRVFDVHANSEDYEWPSGLSLKDFIESLCRTEIERRDH